MKYIVVCFLLSLLPIFGVSCSKYSSSNSGGQTSQSSEEYYTKSLKFPENATIDQKVEMASRLIPTKDQYEWHKLELTAFIHFGINTFTDREWGDGKENPKDFNPTELDVDQWVKTLKDAGFKLIILTAKHHDGFCLWPTSTTEQSIKNSPYKDGKGDIVKEFSDACKKYGVKMGLYLSPWDMNAESYGKGQAYNDFYVAQLTELVSNYGELTELWLDGAKGEGADQDYDIERWLKVLHEYQPNAVSAIMGEDIRWVGNETGYGRETEWSAQAFKPQSFADAKAYNDAVGFTNRLLTKDLGSREVLMKTNINYLFWYPSEVDVSIRKGWFYHKNEEPKSLEALVDIYYNSVGLNSVLLLNVPPDTRGKLDDKDIKVLQDFGNYLNATFSNGLIKDTDTSWNNVKVGESKEYELKQPSDINVVLIQEDIMKGQRVEKFILEVFNNGKWDKVNSKLATTTIGYKRLVKFDTISNAEKIRITIDGARANVNISNVNAYFSEI